MLVKTLDSSDYIAEFKKRFTNFCEKSPILLSYVIVNNQVQVILEESDDIITFDFQYSTDVKEFIYGIRQILIRKAYPIIEKVIQEEVKLTPDEIALIAQSGANIETIPNYKKIERVEKYLIDRVIIYKDIFIVRNLETDKLFRYKLNSSSVFFLRKLKADKYATLQEAGNFFFSNATLLNEIVTAE